MWYKPPVLQRILWLFCVMGLLLSVGSRCGYAAKPQATGGAVANADIKVPPTGGYSIEYAADERSILLVIAKRLTILGQDGRTPLRAADLAKPYRKLFERPKHYAALTPTTFDLIDKTTLVPIGSLKLNCVEAFDLAVHPTRLVSFISLTEEPPARLPRLADQRIVVVDENILSIKRPAQLYGRWLAMDPQGRRLFAGASGFVSAPLALDLNLPNDLANADFPLDVLMALDIEEAGGGVQSLSVNPRAGANGRGVRIAPDGAMVSYVSHSGPSPLSAQVPAFDTQDINKAIATYAMDDVGAIADVAYHPSLLLVAACAEKGVVLFRRDTGEPLKDRLAFGAASPTNPRRLFWSPDGRTLLVDIAAGDSRVLRAYELKLSPTDIEALRPPRPPPE